MADGAFSFLPLLACPKHRTELTQEGPWIKCPQGHRFPVVQDVPVLLCDDFSDTIGIAAESLRLARLCAEGHSSDDPCFTTSLGLWGGERDQLRAAMADNRDGVDPVVSCLVAATNGILYTHLVGSLAEYPIPRLPMAQGNGDLLLDVGCSWGRWSIAAAQRGYCPLGLDPSLGAVLAAKRLSSRLGLPFIGVVGDARFMPFRASAFRAVHSYSVLQHFSKADADLALQEVKRTLHDNGIFRIQMASAWGVRSFQHQVRRRFREAHSFEVRYWSPMELRAKFNELFDVVRMSVDCYFGLGLQPSDLSIMPLSKRAVIHASELLKSVSSRIAPLKYLADSLVFEGRVLRR